MMCGIVHVILSINCPIDFIATARDNFHAYLLIRKLGHDSELSQTWHGSPKS